MPRRPPGKGWLKRKESNWWWSKENGSCYIRSEIFALTLTGRHVVIFYYSYGGEATLGRNFLYQYWEAAWEACIATWNSGSNSVFDALVLRRTTENLDRVGRLQDFPVFKYSNPKIVVLVCAVDLFWKCLQIDLQSFCFIIYMLWMRNEQLGLLLVQLKFASIFGK
jgi:hypothetical protein